MRGTNAHCPFVFLLWFFVSSSPPTLPMGTLLHCLSVTFSPASVSLSFSHGSSTAGSFPGSFCLSLLVSVFRSCLPFFPLAAAVPARAGRILKPKWPRLLPSSDTQENMPEACSPPRQQRLCQKGEDWEGGSGIFSGAAG